MQNNLRIVSEEPNTRKSKKIKLSKKNYAVFGRNISYIYDSFQKQQKNIRKLRRLLTIFGRISAVIFHIIEIGRNGQNGHRFASETRRVSKMMTKNILFLKIFELWFNQVVVLVLQ